MDALGYDLGLFFSQIAALHLQGELFRIHMLDVLYLLEHLFLAVLEGAIGG